MSRAEDRLSPDLRPERQPERHADLHVEYEVEPEAPVEPNKPRDELGLRRALGDPMLPLLVAAMVFLAALALAAALQASAIAAHWREGAASAVTVQVPQPETVLARQSDGPEQTRLDAVLRVLRADRSLANVRLVGSDELAATLRPWLGSDTPIAALPLPAVIELRLADPNVSIARINAALSSVAPGAVAEGHQVWIIRLQSLAVSLEDCGWLALLVVVAVAVAVVMLATRAGLAARRDAIEIVHGLGATDAYIAGRFAGRVTRLAFGGGVLGIALACPLLLGVASLVAPFLAGRNAADGASLMGMLPQRLEDITSIWLAIPALPFIAALIGHLTALLTVRRWLRTMP